MKPLPLSHIFVNLVGHTQWISGNDHRATNLGARFAYSCKHINFLVVNLNVHLRKLREIKRKYEKLREIQRNAEKCREMKNNSDKL